MAVLRHISYLLVGIVLACRPQENNLPLSVPELTPEQMYEDYDSLVRIIEEINPQLAVRKQVMRLDILQELTALRSAIDTSTTSQFYDIIRRALTLCQDGHAGILPPFYFENMEAIRYGMADSLSDKARHHTELYSRYIDSLRSLKQLHLPIHYVDGRYLITYDFHYQGQVIKAGTEIIRCQEKEVHHFVQSLVDQLFLRWDDQHQCFYHEDFLSALNLIRDRRVKLTFQEPGGKQVEQVFDLYDSLRVQPEDKKQKVVRYLKDTQLLYIRVPEMNIRDTSFYSKEIPKYKNQPITKVAIDIRDNRGGSDLVGERIIELLIDQWFYTEIILLARPSPIVADRLDQDLAIAEIVTIPFLDSTRYWKIYHNYKNVFPHPKSIRYNGPIYILQNENIFSAAGTLAAYAEYSDQIISVGNPTGRLLGKGTTPFIFALPHSQLLFRIEPIIDYSGADNAKDMLHDQVDILVPDAFRHDTTDQSRPAKLTDDPIINLVLHH